MYINRTSFERILESPEHMAYGSQAVDDIYGYVSFVMSYSDKKKIAALDKLESYQEAIQRLDERRSQLHEAAMTGLRMMNRMARGMGIEPVYRGGDDSDDRDDRGDMAHAIFAFCKENLDRDMYGEAWTTVSKEQPAKT